MLKEDVEKLVGYMLGHSGRLDKDIANAQKRGDNDKVNFYEGAKGATDMFSMMIHDILNKALDD